MRNSRRLLATLVAVGIGFTTAGATSAEEDVLFRAMRDELARSMESLRVEGLEAPYFISYRVDDTRALIASATFGALVSSAPTRSRTLSVELRVGDYRLDNTNFLTMPSGGSSLSRSFGGRSTMALDDDYQEIRRQIWLATDGAFKSALEQMAQKKAVLQNKTLADDLADFSAAEVVDIEDSRPDAGGELAELQSLAADLSRQFRDRPGIFDSSVWVLGATTRSYFVNSEGTTYERTTPTARLVVEAVTQAPDGMPLSDFVVAISDSVGSLPTADELADEVDEMASRLEGLREAELLDRYNGPVLFEGQAAAELFAQGFARELLAQREAVAGRRAFRVIPAAERDVGLPGPGRCPRAAAISQRRGRPDARGDRRAGAVWGLQSRRRGRSNADDHPDRAGLLANPARWAHSRGRRRNE